jgi:3-oxoadipate enol-lactonase/4-carboxymuconolactone decarboxylase
VTLTAVRLGGGPGLPLLVVGPALGTSATALWGETARLLSDDLQVVGWDLPGHGHNRSVGGALTVPGLAAEVLAAVDRLFGGLQPVSFHYAGASVGGAVGLQLALDAPERVRSAVVVATAARFGTPGLWAERTAAVRTAGTSSLAGASAERWFAPGFAEREPQRSAALLRALSDTDDDGYAAVCGALADFDVRQRLAGIATPLLVVAGEHDAAVPPGTAGEVVRAVAHGRLVVLPGVAHLAPAEDPAALARLVREHVLGPPPPSRDELTVAELRAAGTAVRREVLGDAEVEAPTAGTSDLTREYEQLVTEQVWGGIWTRPGLDRRQRSLVALTALVVRGHHDALATHLRAARRSGLTVEEIREALLQAAVYSGVPDAAAAFRIARRTLEEEDA